jgi:hypothetical protein
MAIMVRAAAQYLPLAMLLLVLAVPMLRERDWRKGLFVGLVFLVALVLPLAPWLHRNVTQFDSLALTSQGGVHLLYWVTPKVISFSQGISEEQALNDLRIKFHSYMEVRGHDVETINIFHKNRSMAGFSLALLSEVPFYDIVGSWGSGMAVNLIAPAIGADPRVRAMPHPGFSETSHLDPILRIMRYIQEASPVYLATIATGIVSAVLASLLQIYGFVLFSRASGWAAFIAVVCMLYVLLISGPITAPKYRLPLEPFLIILQTMALVELWPRLRRMAGGRI